MLNIVLLCQWGASTTMLAEKLVESAKKRGIEAVANAYPTGKISEVIGSADIVLLGPQVRFKLKTYITEFADSGVPIIALDPVAYGRMDSESIIDLVLETIKENL